MGETTCQRCVWKLAHGLVNCHILSEVYRENQPRVIHVKLHSCIIVPTRYQGCWVPLMRQKFIGRIVQPLQKEVSRIVKICCHLSQSSCQYKFMVLGCCIWISWETKWYQHLADVGVVQVYDKCRKQKIDHDFFVDGQVYSKLFYLIDRICPCLTCFLGTATDSITKLDSSFFNQKTARKEVEQRFWCFEP